MNEFGKTTDPSDSAETAVPNVTSAKQAEIGAVNGMDVVRPNRDTRDSWFVRSLAIFIGIILGVALADIGTDMVVYFTHKIPSRIVVKSTILETQTDVSDLRRTVVVELLAKNPLDHTNYVPGLGDVADFVDLDPSKAVPTTLRYDLVGTLVFSDPNLSLATLAKGRELVNFFNHEIIEPGYKLWLVERNKIYIHNIQRNQLEFLEIKEAAPPRARAVAPRRPVERPAEIQAVGDSQFTIERSFVNEKLENLQDLLTQARAVQTPDGFQLVSIAPGSLYEAIGLQPGDVIVGVNDQDINTQADAIMLYNQFKSAHVSRIQLRLLRDGQATTLFYDLK